VTIEGRVANPGTRTLSDLRAAIRPGEAAGGVRVAELITSAGAEPTASHVTVIARDEAYRASIPIGDLSERGWLSFGESDDDATGDFRLTVRDGATLCWNVKHVATLRVTDGPEPDDVPEQPRH
jgi:hypothetical protein